MKNIEQAKKPTIFVTEEKGTKEVFISFHAVAADGSEAGFGNFIGFIDPEHYQGSKSRFVVDAQEFIARQLQEISKKSIRVRVMWWQ